MKKLLLSLGALTAVVAPVAAVVACGSDGTADIKNNVGQKTDHKDADKTMSIEQTLINTDTVKVKAQSWEQSVAKLRAKAALEAPHVNAMKDQYIKQIKEFVTDPAEQTKLENMVNAISNQALLSAFEGSAEFTTLNSYAENFKQAPKSLDEEKAMYLDQIKGHASDGDSESLTNKLNSIKTEDELEAFVLGDEFNSKVTAFIA